MQNKIKKAFIKNAKAWRKIAPSATIALKKMEIKGDILTWHTGRFSMEYKFKETNSGFNFLEVGTVRNCITR